MSWIVLGQVLRQTLTQRFRHSGQHASMLWTGSIEWISAGEGNPSEVSESEDSAAPAIAIRAVELATRRAVRQAPPCQLGMDGSL